MKIHFTTVCPTNYFGPNCARCRWSCRSCDPITENCTQCNGSFYGEYCQHSCPEKCLNTTCDQRTGSCNYCKEGFEGKSCEHEITTLSYDRLYKYFEIIFSKRYQSIYLPYWLFKIYICFVPNTNTYEMHLLTWLSF